MDEDAAGARLRVHHGQALARIVIENNWQDQAFIDKWVANTWEVDQGYGRGTRNTGWQWRTTWGTWQSDWTIEDVAAKLDDIRESGGERWTFPPYPSGFVDHLGETFKWAFAERGK